MLNHEAEHEKAAELMPEYALGSLSLDERLLVERHASRCPPCTEELQRYQAAADLLPTGMLLVDPPADLKDRILARARLSAAHRPAATANGSVALPGRPTPLEDGSRPAVAAPLSWRERFAMALRRSAPAWGMAGLAVLLLLAFSVGLLWARANQPPAPESATTLRTVALEAAPVAPGATGMLVISLDGEHGTLVVDALPVLPESQEYQLWLVKNEMRVSGGVFGVSKDGYGAVWVHAPDALASYETAGVTIEPAGGSPYPTGDRVLYGDLHSYPR